MEPYYHSRVLQQFNILQNYELHQYTTCGRQSRGMPLLVHNSCLCGGTHGRIPWRDAIVQVSITSSVVPRYDIWQDTMRLTPIGMVESNEEEMEFSNNEYSNEDFVDANDDQLEEEVPMMEPHVVSPSVDNRGISLIVQAIPMVSSPVGTKTLTSFISIIKISLNLIIFCLI